MIKKSQVRRGFAANSERICLSRVFPTSNNPKGLETGLERAFFPGLPFSRQSMRVSENLEN